MLKVVLNNTVHVSAKIKLGPGVAKLNDAIAHLGFGVNIVEGKK